jgi:hypothetical protein
MLGWGHTLPTWLTSVACVHVVVVGCIGCVVQDAALAAETEAPVELPELMPMLILEPDGAWLLLACSHGKTAEYAPGLTWLRLDMQAI